MRPAVIIGGGPAGASAALTLRRSGQPVLLLERSAGPVDKVCGDFLGAASIRQAEAFGLDPTALGARPVARLRLVHRSRVTDTALPFRAYGLSRRLLDEALLRRAAEAGARVIRGHAASAVRQEGPDLVIRAETIGEITTGAVFLATGRHDLPGHGRSGQSPGATGMKTYFRLRRRQHAQLVGHVELILFRGGYASLLPVEEDRCAMAVLLTNRRRWDAWSDLLTWLQETCPLLTERLNGAVPLLEQPLTTASLPFGYVHRPRSADHDGLFRLGDQAALIPSLTADGVSIAMRSGVRAAQTWLSGMGANEYHRRLRAMLWPRMRFGALLSRAGAQDTVDEIAPVPATSLSSALSMTARWTRLQA